MSNPTSPWRLELISGPSLSSSAWLLQDQLRLGRAPDSDVLLPAPTVSRHHALLEWRDEAAWLTDLGSRLGAEVNGQLLARGIAKRLRSGDAISIAAWRFLLRAPGAPRREIAIDQDEAGGLATVRAGGDALGTLAEQRLALLLEFAAALSQASDMDALAALLCRHAVAGSGYSRAAVITLNAGEEPEPLALFPENAAERIPLRMSRTLLKTASERGLATLEAPQGAALNQSLIGIPLRRALAACIRVDEAPAAWLYLDSGTPPSSEHADAPAFCQALAQLAAVLVSSQRRAESERLRRELHDDALRAHEVQQRLLPERRGRIAGLHYALHMQAGETVAGDLVDVFALPEGRCAIALGDVSGSGLGAGMVMATVQAFLRARLPLDPDPASTVNALNLHLAQHASGGQFVTLWLGVVEVDGRCRYVDAGHSHACVVDAGECNTLVSEGGIPLGITETLSYCSETLQLDSKRRLVLFSDGVVEQRNANGEPFSAQRLHTLLAKARGNDDLLEAILAELEIHRGDAARDDDVTVLVVRHAIH